MGGTMESGRNGYRSEAEMDGCGRYRAVVELLAVGVARAVEAAALNAHSEETSDGNDAHDDANAGPTMDAARIETAGRVIAHADAIARDLKESSDSLGC